MGVVAGGTRMHVVITLKWATALAVTVFFNTARAEESCEQGSGGTDPVGPRGVPSVGSGESGWGFAIAIITTLGVLLVWRVTRSHAGRGGASEGSVELGNGKQAPRVHPKVTKQALLSTRTLSSWTPSDFDITDQFDMDPEPLLPRHEPPSLQPA